MTTSSKTAPSLAHDVLARLRLGFLRSMMHMPKAVQSRLGKGPKENGGQPLSSELRWLLRVLSWDPMDYAKADPSELRASFETIATSEMSGPWIDLQTEDVRISNGDANIPVRVYSPRYAKPGRPLLFWMHGGGWVIGSINTHDRFCRQLCDSTGAIIVAAD